MDSFLSIPAATFPVAASVSFNLAKIFGTLLLFLVIYVILRMVGVVRGGGVENTKKGNPEARPDSLRALRLTMSAPAFLVPTVMAVVTTILFAVFYGRNYALGENPLPMPFRSGYIPNDPVNWAILGLVSVYLAGFVGLMQAARLKQPLGSSAFWEGVKSHSATIFLGKLLLLGGITTIAHLIGTRPTWENILFVVPNLILAPLLGSAALNPGNPAAAIRDCLRRSTTDVYGTGKLVTLQVLVMLVLWVTLSQAYSQQSILHKSLLEGVIDIQILANGVSMLSFNTYPVFHQFMNGFFLEVFVAAAMVISSTVFLAAHMLRVFDVEARTNEGVETQTASA